METIKDTVYRIITDKLGIDKAALTNEADFYNDLGVDSLDFFELMGDIEKAFNIVIEEEVYERLKTVGSLVKLAEEKANSVVV